MYRIRFFYCFFNNDREKREKIQMLPGFASIVETKIKNAQKNGELDNLPGEGKPLSFEEIKGPEELKLAHKVLKNAGFLPPEIELKKQIGQIEDLLETIEYDSPERIRIQKKLNYLFTKLSTMRGNSNTTMFPEMYRDRLIKRMI